MRIDLLPAYAIQKPERRIYVDLHKEKSFLLKLFLVALAILLASIAVLAVGFFGYLFDLSPAPFVLFSVFIGAVTGIKIADIIF